MYILQNPQNLIRKCIEHPFKVYLRKTKQNITFNIKENVYTYPHLTCMQKFNEI